jgi:bifunctional non-homologous end joining protein LigD
MPNKSLPQFVEPMAATSVKEPFDSPDWIFEPKLDGYRAITVIDSTGKARLWSRNHLPLEPKFPTIQDAVNELKLRSTILDGEIVALDKDGVPRFQLLQQWQKLATAPVVLYLFDLLWSDGRDITGKTVLQRRERLQEITLQSPVFRSVVMLVCEAAFAEWTEDEQLRQTTFLGWRDDKNAELVTRNL